MTTIVNDGSELRKMIIDRLVRYYVYPGWKPEIKEVLLKSALDTLATRTDAELFDEFATELWNDGLQSANPC